MNEMIIKAAEANPKAVGPMKLKEYNISEEFSCTLVEIDGKHGMMNNPIEDRIYFVLEGVGVFILDGKEQKVGAQDLVFIPKNTPYNIT